MVSISCIPSWTELSPDPLWGSLGTSIEVPMSAHILPLDHPQEGCHRLGVPVPQPLLHPRSHGAPRLAHNPLLGRASAPPQAVGNETSRPLLQGQRPEARGTEVRVWQSQPPLPSPTISSSSTRPSPKLKPSCSSWEQATSVLCTGEARHFLVQYLSLITGDITGI